MNNILSNLTVIILTYKTDLEILSNCIKSIDHLVSINLVENSREFKNKDLIKKINPKINFFCTGENLGYSGGNNFGLEQTNTRYALILNPDTICAPNFFENIKKYINGDVNFSIIGAQYNNDSTWQTHGFFDEKKNSNNQYDQNNLIKTEWVMGCSMLIDLNKFEKKNLFDTNFFLFFEEFDLCKQVVKTGGKVFSSKSLLIDHLGFKGSFGSEKEFEIYALKIKNWHFMWSFFYYHKKNDGYFFALKKSFGRLLRSILKTFYYFLLFNKYERTKYFYRFLGLYNSILGKKSSFRINF